MTIIKRNVKTEEYWLLKVYFKNFNRIQAYTLFAKNNTNIINDKVVCIDGRVIEAIRM